MLSLVFPGASTEYPLPLQTQELQGALDDLYDAGRLGELIDPHAMLDALRADFACPPKTDWPRPRLGCIYWPVVGWARYAFACLLVDEYTVGVMRTAMTGASSNAVTVKLRDDPDNVSETAWSVPMHFLASRPLVRTTSDPLTTDDNGTAPVDAWVVILVDDRYPALFTGPPAVGTPWDQLIYNYSGAAKDTPDSAYLAPGSRWTNSRTIGRSVAWLTDIAALSAGQRIVKVPGATVENQNANATNRLVLATAHATALADGRHSGGGPVELADYDAGMPESAWVHFGGPDETAPAQNIVNFSFGYDWGLGYGESVSHWADAPASTSSGNRSALATKWATDWAAWQSGLYDTTYSGFVAAPRSGFCWAVEWYHDAGKAYTKFVRPPHWYGYLLAPQVGTASIPTYQPGDAWKEPVALASTTPLPANTYSAGVLTATANGALTSIDPSGYAPTVGMRLLIAGEATTQNNGIYTVTQVGTGGTPYILTRATDADENAELPGLQVRVFHGTWYNTAWRLDAPAYNTAFTLGITALTFTQIGEYFTGLTSGAGNILVADFTNLRKPAISDASIVGNSFSGGGVFSGGTSTGVFGSQQTTLNLYPGNFTGTFVGSGLSASTHGPTITYGGGTSTVVLGTIEFGVGADTVTFSADVTTHSITTGTCNASGGFSVGFSGTGLTGTLGPGAAATGGIITNPGSGSYGNALTTQPLSQFASTTSAQLAGVMSDETGSGSLVFATNATLINPALGTPASGTLTNCTGLPISTGVSGLATGAAAFLATATSANLATLVSDETGSGSLVFANSPAFTTPNIGVATATSVNKVTITAPATGSTLTVADGKTFTASNTLTLTGTDGSTLAIGTGGTLGTAAYTAASDYVPTTRTVNGHALSANVTVTASDVGLGSVTNDAQTKAAVVPNTAPSAGQILTGNAGGTAYAPQTVSGDATLASTGALTIGSNKVTAAKMSASATDVLFGRSTAGAGGGEEIACTATARSILDDTSTGAVLTTLGGTTVGKNLFTLANPSSITFPRINADNTVDALSASAFRTAIGASATGTVTTNTSTDLSLAITNPTTTPDYAVNPNWLTGRPLINGYFVTSVSGNAVTFTLKGALGNTPSATEPVKVSFPSTTGAAPTVISITAATSFTVTSGSTLGQSNGVPFRVWLVGFNDGGTFRLGAIVCYNPASGALTPLRDGATASSTAEGGAGGADLAGIFFTGTAVTTKQYRILGYATWESGLATAGTWGVNATDNIQFGPGVQLPGETVQANRSDYQTSATGTTLIPHDNTIPLVTEGDPYMSYNATWTSAANIARVRAQGIFANDSGVNNLVMSLFTGAVGGCLKATWVTDPSASYAVQLNIDHVAKCNGTGETFSVRAGSGSAGTTTFNGNVGAQKYGGVLNSYITVDEVMT